MKKLLLLWFLWPLLPALAQNTKFTVAQDGSGTHSSVQAALDAVPIGNRNLITIFIKKGTYKEKLSLAKKKNFVKLVGEDLTRTILTYDDYNGRPTEGGEPMSTSNSATFKVFGHDFTAENLTFENTAGDASQAVAVWVYGDRVQFKNCRFLGFKDTLYTNGYGSRQYYQDCYIEGITDFILGSSTAFFEDCTLFCKPGGSCLSAASTPDTTRYGYVFQHCKIVGDAPTDSYFLGRPWKPFAKTVFINCEMSDIIKEKGWDHWGKETNKQDAFFAEYKSTGPGAAPKKRILWSHQLTKEQLAFYTRDVVLRGWKPNH